MASVTGTFSSRWVSILFDDHRIFNAGDDVHGAAAFMAGFNIDVA